MGGEHVNVIHYVKRQNLEREIQIDQMHTCLASRVKSSSGVIAIVAMSCGCITM
jgi:hypothetical protein